VRNYLALMLCRSIIVKCIFICLFYGEMKLCKTTFINCRSHDVLYTSTRCIHSKHYRNIDIGAMPKFLGGAMLQGILGDFSVDNEQTRENYKFKNPAILQHTILPNFLMKKSLHISNLFHI